jgi:hypothetical protein
MSNCFRFMVLFDPKEIQGHVRFPIHVNLVAIRFPFLNPKDVNSLGCQFVSIYFQFLFLLKKKEI